MPRGVPKVKAQEPTVSSQSSVPPTTPVSSGQSPLPITPATSKPAVAEFKVPVTTPSPSVQSQTVAQPVIPIKCNNCAAHGQVGNAFIDPKTNRYNCFTCGSNGVALIEETPRQAVAPIPEGYHCPKCMSTRVAPTSPTGNYACGNPICQHTWILGAEAASLVSSRPAQIDTTNLAAGGGAHTPSQTVSTALGQGGGSPRK